MPSNEFNILVTWPDENEAIETLYDGSLDKYLNPIPITR